MKTAVVNFATSYQESNEQNASNNCISIDSQPEVKIFRSQRRAASVAAADPALSFTTAKWNFPSRDSIPPQKASKLVGRTDRTCDTHSIESDEMTLLYANVEAS